MACTQPKRPLSAYMLWLKHARKELLKRHPEMTVTDIAKRGGEIWRKMTAREKDFWIKKSAEARKDYTKNLDRFISNGGEVRKRRQKKSKKSKKTKKSKDTTSTGNRRKA